ncbi:germination protein YpeB [Sporolactobacillus vineae]|uniref:germination protein YpeB n=1 Tax=Sporolactobacillus vineae TaxID=444463 RepID=UPI0002885DFF|nr:germination protein YpeB [Sporolactobacillus vineae]
MKRWRTYALMITAAAALVILAAWGWQEHRMRNAVTIHAENHYQQAYHELTYYVDALQNALGVSLAMQSRNGMRPQLAESWRLSTLAHAAANELPLTLLPFNRANEFLAHVGEFTYQSAVKPASSRPLTDHEYHTLQTLYRESEKISDGLREVQGTIMTRHLKWMDVETALNGQKQNQDNQVIDGMKQINIQATDYTQDFSPENPRNMALQKNKLNKLTGAQISKEQAAGKLKAMIGVRNAALRQIKESGRGSHEQSYELSVKADGGPVTAGSVSKKGGHVLWYMINRPVHKEEISLGQATEKADRFLRERGFHNLTLTKRNQYQNVAVLTYVRQIKNVRIYPASIKLKVAMDNGQIIAFDQMNYLFHKCEKIPLVPKVSEKSVRSQINKDLKVREVNLAVIQNGSLDNILCYELFVTKGEKTYRMLLNAANGDQEKMELVGN